MTRTTHSPTAAARPVLARLAGASKRYGQVAALDRLDLAVHAGEVLAVLGANGAGKTTALGLLTGRIGADAGVAELFGRDPRDPVARRGIGVMLQDGDLPDTLRVAEHVRLFSSYYPAPRHLDDTLALAGVSDLAGRSYGVLSGGQKRRVQFALAICGRPPLLFVDEPTVGLDGEARRGFGEVIRRLRAEGTAIVLTTHYLEEADALADRIVLMAGGRLLADDTPARIKALADGKRVLARSRLDAASLAAWPEADGVQARNGRLEVSTRQPEALLRRWLAADERLSDLEVRPLPLEDAVLALTARNALERAA